MQRRVWSRRATRHIFFSVRSCLPSSDDLLFLVSSSSSFVFLLAHGSPACLETGNRRAHTEFKFRYHSRSTCGGGAVTKSEERIKRVDEQRRMVYVAPCHLCCFAFAAFALPILSLKGAGQHPFLTTIQFSWRGFRSDFWLPCSSHVACESENASAFSRS